MDIALQQVGMKTDGKISQQCVKSLGIRWLSLAIEDIEKLRSSLGDVLARNQVIDNEVSSLVRQGLATLFWVIGSIDEQQSYPAIGDQATTQWPIGDNG